MIVTGVKTFYRVQCEWGRCRARGPESRVEAMARPLAAGEGWEYVLATDKWIDACPDCYRKHGKGGQR